MFVILSRQYNQSIMRFCGNDRRVRFGDQTYQSDFDRMVAETSDDLTE